MSNETMIKAYVIGIPKGKRKTVTKWIETAYEALPDTQDKAKELAVHLSTYQVLDHGWREMKVRAFGAFKTESRNGMRWVNLFPDKQIEVKNVTA